MSFGPCAASWCTMMIRNLLPAALLGLAGLVSLVGCDVPLQDYYELRSANPPKGVAYDPGPQVFYTTSLVGGEIVGGRDRRRDWRRERAVGQGHGWSSERVRRVFGGVTRRIANQAMCGADRPRR